MSVTWHGVTLTIEVGFASLPSVAIGSTTWTDVSAYVRSISLRRGRNSETGSFGAGSMQIVLDNRDRRFDPNYTSSPYSPNVLPMRRIRFKVTYNAITYDVWSGFVDDWPQEYDIGNTDATVTVGCTDGSKVLSLMKLAESVHWYTVTDLSPAAWWRLGEQSGTFAADSTGHGYNGVYAGGATFLSRPGLVIGSSDAAIGFDAFAVMFAVSPVSAYPVTVEAWISTTTVTAGKYLSIPVGTSSTEIFLESRTDGKIRANVGPNGNDGALFFTGSATTVNDGLTHHVVAVYANSTSSPTLYIDGVVESAIAGSQAAANNDASLVTIGGDDTGNKIDATIDEVAIYSASLSVGDVTTLYGGGSTPWEGDGTGARIGRYLDRAAWPSADRTIATGISTLQLVSLGSADVLSLSRIVEESEQGQMFMGANGQVIFRDRHWRFENILATASNATFGDGAGELDYSNIVTDGGEQFITNHVRAVREGGATVEVSDATSITKFFERTDDVTGLQNQSDLEVVDLANWRLATRKNPVQRVTVLEVRPRRDPANLFPQVLGRDIGHRLTEKRRPQGVGTALTYTDLIEGIQHSITTAGDWVTTFYLSSSDSQATEQPLILDNATFGILDTNVLAY